MPDDSTPAAASAGGMDAIFAEVGITEADFGGDTPAVETAPAAATQEDAPAQEGRVRDEHGRFAAKDADGQAEQPAKPEAKPAEAAAGAAPAAPAVDAPAGFSEAGKAAWASAPDAVKADVRRRFTELETGLRGYQQDFGPLREFAALAKSQGQTPAAVVQNYVAIEKQLAADPIKGLDLIARNMGMDLRAVAAQVLGQPAPAGGEPAKDNVIADLRREIAELRQGFGGVQQTIQEQRTAAIERDVEAFAASAPRFEELAGEISEMLRTGYAKDLRDAYTKADRLNPLPPAPVAEPAPQTRKPANLSVSGAPASGSNPSTRKPPASLNAHMDEIFRQVGIS